MSLLLIRAGESWRALGAPQVTRRPLNPGSAVLRALDRAGSEKNRGVNIKEGEGAAGQFVELLIRQREELNHLTNVPLPPTLDGFS